MSQRGGGRGNVVDELGHTYGVVTVAARAGHMGQDKKKGAAWSCHCSVCGGRRIIRGTQLRKDPPKTCMGRCIRGPQ